MLSDRGAGFSLIELIIVISILTVLASISTSAYANLRAQSNLEIATGSVVEALRLAKSNAEQVQGDTTWGVYVTSTQVTVFAGASYIARDTSKDKVLALPGGITVSGLSEVVFDKVMGTTATVGTITVLNADASNDIVINEKGTLTY